jgi:hypothetical protein
VGLAAGLDDPGVTEPIRLLLEIEPVEDSMLGQISTSTGEIRAFVGWLGPLNRLEALIEDRQSQPGEPEESLW